jgi:lipopolysaccharide/colanic/teichoic acid biosynthesis glycosyltransferase
MNGTPDPLFPVASLAPGPIRRFLDVALSTLGLLLLGPVVLALWIAIRLTSPGPGFFRQQRVGQGGRPFMLYKLRTMRNDASGPGITSADDPRVTRIGAVLRATSADELPQLWNVLRGDMTLVGPRPESLHLAARYAPECRWVFAHRPGLTGPSQLRLRDTSVFRETGPVDEGWYLEHLVPLRLELDERYLMDPSFGATIRILRDTVRGVTKISGSPVPHAEQ